MSKNKTGNFIAGGKPQVPALSSNNGIFDIKDVYTAANNNAWQETDGYYEIPRSLRFRHANGAFLSRTPSTAGSRTTWTYSFWAKLGRLDISDGIVLTAGSTGNPITEINFGPSGVGFITYDGSYWNFTQPTYYCRDPSAWYHVVIAMDTNNAVQANRGKIYLNGKQMSTGTNFSQGYAHYINGTYTHYIGNKLNYPNQQYFDGYLAEMNLIDGQALDPSYFGYFDPVTNIWQPKPYTGSYGTNGFYLPFKDNQTTYNIAKNYGSPSNYFVTTDQLSNASYWANQGVTPVKNATDPFGVANNAWTITATTTGYDVIYRTYFGGSTPVANMQWCASTYYKAGTRTTTVITMGDDLLVNKIWCAFDLARGVLDPSNSGSAGNATNLSYGIQNVGNGWYRCWVSAQLGSTTQCRVDFGGGFNNGETWLMYGPQLNVGSAPDASYINSSTSPYSADWTPNNFSLTSGATYDSMVDSPTNVFTTATDIGGVVSGNYATWNPADKGGSMTLNNGNLDLSNGASYSAVRATMALPTSGKYYWEWKENSTRGSNVIGEFFIVGPNTTITGNATGTGVAGVYWGSSGIQFYADSVYSSWMTTYIGSGDIVQFAVDMDAGKFWIGINNTWYRYTGNYPASPTLYSDGNPSAGTNQTGSLTTSQTWIPYMNSYSCNGSANFGQRPFTYTPPTGFKSLNTTNLQALGSSAVGNAGIPGSKNMDAIFWYGRGRDNSGNGNNADYDIKGLSFKPDMIWTKNLDNSEDHYIFDSARGFSAYTQISFNKGNSTGLEGSGSNIGVIGSSKATYISKANSDGFTISQATPTGNGGELNYLARLYDSWCWKQATGVFTMVTYSGNGANRSITHNLGVAPAFMIVKGRDNSGGGSSWVYHKSYNSAAAIDRLDSVGTGANNNSYTTVFNSTAPTSSNFSVGTSTDVNGSGYNYIAYLWAEVPGFSKFGTYVGNSSSDGPFIYCGFRPKFIIIRSVTNSSPNNRDWLLKTSKDNNYNGWSTSDYKGGAQAIIAGAAYTGSGVYSDFIDYTSNGFKIRNAGSPNYNGGETYMYCAWADNPFALNNRAF